MVIQVDDITDAAARTSNSRRFKVLFEDGTVSTVWPRSMTLVSGDGVVDLTTSSDDDDDVDMDADEGEGSSSGSSNAV